MKSLKKLLKEADPGQSFFKSAHQPGADKNWSISASDLAKKAQDQQFISKLKQHTPYAHAELVKMMSGMVPDRVLAALSDEDFKNFMKRLGEALDTKRVISQEEKSKPSPSSGVAAVTKPEKTVTRS